MSTTRKYAALGTDTVVMTNTNLSALANNALFLSAAINNVQGGGLDGYPLMRLTFICTMAVAATANTGFAFWFLKSNDASNYEAGGTGYTPLRAPDLVIPAPVDTTQRQVSVDVPAPAGLFKILMKNDGTGQALKTDTTSAGSQVSVAAITEQMV